MKNTLMIIGFFLASVSSQGCFEVREEVNMKADGSGEVSVVVNLSQSKGKLRQYMKMQSVEGYRVPSQSEIESLLLQIKSTVRDVQGISYVQTKSDWTNFIFTVTARFDEIKALNTAITRLGEQLDHLNIPHVPKANFTYEGKNFRRIFDYPVNPEKFQQLPSMQRYMLESARAISIYRFEKTIDDISHDKAILSPSGKAVMLNLPVADLATGKGTMANTISFDD